MLFFKKNCIIIFKIIHFINKVRTVFYKKFSSALFLQSHTEKVKEHFFYCQCYSFLLWRILIILLLLSLSSMTWFSGILLMITIFVFLLSFYCPLKVYFCKRRISCVISFILGIFPIIFMCWRKSTSFSINSRTFL